MKIALTPQLLVSAYAQGYFPMGREESSEILWYNPDPRAIIPLDNFHLSRRLAREMRKQKFRVSFDEDFGGVMRACAEREDTWITDALIQAYTKLHKSGFAHSVEVWDQDRLVGGTYGVSIGGVFFAESKFKRKDNASKMALFHLVQRLKSRGFKILEVQFLTEHLKSLGAVEIPKADYLLRLAEAIELPTDFNDI